MLVKTSLVSESAPRSRSLKTLGLIMAIALGVLVSAFVLRSRPSADTATLRQMARDSSQRGQWSMAESFLDRLPDPLPDDWLLRAVVATSLNKPEAASQYLAKIDSKGPLAAKVALVSSSVELDRHRARPMEEALRLALRLDPKLAEARRRLVFLYGTQGR